MRTEHPLRPSTLAGAFVLAGILVSCSGNQAPTPPASVGIGQNGGTVRVDQGSLAGTQVVIAPNSIVLPPNAGSDQAQITITQGQVTELVEFVAVGPAANFGPQGVTFDPAAIGTLVFDPTLVPPGATATDVLVKRSNSQGRITDLHPTAVDLDAGTVEIEMTQFSTYWVVVEVFPLNLARDYFPMLNGDRYEFDNGISLGIADSISEPNLQGVPLSRLVFQLGTEDLGLYLQRALGATVVIGEFSISVDFQRIDRFPLVLLPTNAKLGTSVASDTDYLGYVPFSTVSPAFDGFESARVTVVSQGRLTTPLGVFTDVIEVVFERESKETNGSITTTGRSTDHLWLARDVGPVAVEIGGLPVGTGGLVDGLVDGRLILPR